jgi:hypothetical protein
METFQLYFHHYIHLFILYQTQFNNNNNYFDSFRLHFVVFFFIICYNLNTFIKLLK